MADNTTDAQQAPYIYYYSDPDEGDKLLHHLPIPSYIDLSDYIAQGKLWKVYNIGAPDKSLVDPVVDIKGTAPHWVENDKNAQTEVLAEAQEKINDLDQAKQALDQDVKEVKQAQASASQQQSMALQQSLGLAKTINGLTKAQQANTQMMTTMQKLLLDIQKKISTGSTASDDKTGGNK